MLCGSEQLDISAWFAWLDISSWGFELSDNSSQGSESQSETTVHWLAWPECLSFGQLSQWWTIQRRYLRQRGPTPSTQVHMSSVSLVSAWAGRWLSRASSLRQGMRRHCRQQAETAPYLIAQPSPTRKTTSRTHRRVRGPGPRLRGHLARRAALRPRRSRRREWRR